MVLIRCACGNRNTRKKRTQKAPRRTTGRRVKNITMHAHHDMNADSADRPKLYLNRNCRFAHALKESEIQTDWYIRPCTKISSILHAPIHLHSNWPFTYLNYLNCSNDQIRILHTQTTWWWSTAPSSDKRTLRILRNDYVMVNRTYATWWWYQMRFQGMNSRWTLLLWMQTERAPTPKSRFRSRVRTSLPRTDF